MNSSLDQARSQYDYNNRPTLVGQPGYNGISRYRAAPLPFEQTPQYFQIQRRFQEQQDAGQIQDDWEDEQSGFDPNNPPKPNNVKGSAGIKMMYEGGFTGFAPPQNEYQALVGEYGPPSLGFGQGSGPTDEQDVFIIGQGMRRVAYAKPTPGAYTRMMLDRKNMKQEMQAKGLDLGGNPLPAAAQGIQTTGPQVIDRPTPVGPNKAVVPLERKAKKNVGEGSQIPLSQVIAAVRSLGLTPEQRRKMLANFKLGDFDVFEDSAEYSPGLDHGSNNVRAIGGEAGSEVMFDALPKMAGGGATINKPGRKYVVRNGVAGYEDEAGNFYPDGGEDNGGDSVDTPQKFEDKKGPGLGANNIPEPSTNPDMAPRELPLKTEIPGTVSNPGPDNGQAGMGTGPQLGGTGAGSKPLVRDPRYWDLERRTSGDWYWVPKPGMVPAGQMGTVKEELADFQGGGPEQYMDFIKNPRDLYPGMSEEMAAFMMGRGPAHTAEATGNLQSPYLNGTPQPTRFNPSSPMPTPDDQFPSLGTEELRRAGQAAPPGLSNLRREGGRIVADTIDSSSGQSYRAVWDGQKWSMQGNGGSTGTSSNSQGTSNASGQTGTNVSQGTNGTTGTGTGTGSTGTSSSAGSSNAGFIEVNGERIPIDVARGLGTDFTSGRHPTLDDFNRRAEGIRDGSISSTATDYRKLSQMPVPGPGEYTSQADGQRYRVRQDGGKWIVERATGGPAQVGWGRDGDTVVTNSGYEKMFETSDIADMKRRWAMLNTGSDPANITNPEVTRQMPTDLRSRYETDPAFRQAVESGVKNYVEPTTQTPQGTQPIKPEQVPQEISYDDAVAAIRNNQATLERTDGKSGSEPVTSGIVTMKDGTRYVYNGPGKPLTREGASSQSQEADPFGNRTGSTGDSSSGNGANANPRVPGEAVGLTDFAEQDGQLSAKAKIGDREFIATWNKESGTWEVQDDPQAQIFQVKDKPGLLVQITGEKQGHAYGQGSDGKWYAYNYNNDTWGEIEKPSEQAKPQPQARVSNNRVTASGSGGNRQASSSSSGTQARALQTPTTPTRTTVTTSSGQSIPVSSPAAASQDVPTTQIPSGAQTRGTVQGGNNLPMQVIHNGMQYSFVMAQGDLLIYTGTDGKMYQMTKYGFLPL